MPTYVIAEHLSVRQLIVQYTCDQVMLVYIYICIRHALLWVGRRPRAVLYQGARVGRHCTSSICCLCLQGETKTPWKANNFLCLAKTFQPAVFKIHGVLLVDAWLWITSLFEIADEWQWTRTLSISASLRPDINKQELLVESPCKTSRMKVPVVLMPRCCAA